MVELQLKVEHLEFSNTATTQISEFQIMLNVALEWANKLSTEIMKVNTNYKTVVNFKLVIY